MPPAMLKRGSSAFANAPPAAPAAALYGPPIVPSSGPASPPKPSASELAALSLLTAYEGCGDAHASMLEYMRWRRDEAVRSEPSIAPSAEMGSDLRLHRFLVSTQWDASAAADAYVEALRWRKERKMDCVRDRIISANPGFFGGGETFLDDALCTSDADEAVQRAQPRTFTRAAGGRHELLLDKLGNLVLIDCPGAVDNAGVSAIGVGRWTEAFLGHNELVVLLLDELSRRQKRLALGCKISDMAGYKLVGFGKSREEKEAEAAAKAAGKLASAAYPTTTYKMIFLGLPGASMAGPVIKSLAPARSAKKIVLAKSNEELKAYVDVSQLPARLGGTLPDGMQWANRKKK